MQRTVMYIRFHVICGENFNDNFQKLAVSFPVLYRRVTKALAERAHSTKLANMSTSQAGPNSEGASEEISKSSSGTVLAYMNPAKITEQQKVKIELLMFRMFICCALPWALMDSQFFVAFVLALAPNFIVARFCRRV